MKHAFRFARLFTALLLLSALTLRAGDINKGYTFTLNEQNVTHTKLNNLVDGASINTTFFTDKSAETTPAAADTFLVYSPSLSGFRKLSFQNLLLGNTAFITGQTEDATPATDDYVLSYDTSAGLYKKVRLDALALPNTGLISSLPLLSSNLLPDAYFPLLNDGTNNKAPLSLLLSQWQLYSFTNLTALTAQTNADQLLIWDSANSTNRKMSVAAWFTNPPIAATFTNDDSILFWSSATNAADGTNGRLKRLTMAGLFTNPPTSSVFTNTDTIAVWSTATNGPAGTNPSPARIQLGTILARTFTSTQYPLPGAGVLTNIAHSLPGTPQAWRWVLVCTTSDQGYAVGDEVPTTEFQDTGSALGAFYAGANATNIFLLQGDNARIRNKSTTSFGNITSGSWRIKAYASWNPY